LDGRKGGWMVPHPGPLLRGRERHHAVFPVGIAKRRKDPAADAEIRMPVVRLFHSVLERERDSSKAGRCHQEAAEIKSQIPRSNPKSLCVSSRT
jgi:hypothetical protein